MENKQLSNEQTFAVFVIAVACFIAGSVLGAHVARSRSYWVSEPYEPTIKITSEDGVKDTTYGYSLDEILEK